MVVSSGSASGGASPIGTVIVEAPVKTHALVAYWSDFVRWGLAAPAATPPATPAAAPDVPAATRPSAPRSSCTQPVLRALFSKVDTLARLVVRSLPTPPQACPTLA